MSDRHQIIDDADFWLRLEYDASHRLGRSDDRTLRPFWIDGFLPESATDTKRGVDVTGIAWVGKGSRNQHPYRFIVSVPQAMLVRRRRSFFIEDLLLDATQQTLRIQVAIEKQAS